MEKIIQVSPRIIIILASVIKQKVNTKNLLKFIKNLCRLKKIL